MDLNFLSALQKNLAITKDFYSNSSSGKSESIDFMKFCLENFMISHSQIFQDLLVLFLLNKKENGFFVEFGAANGKERSNSFLLEKRFGWNGILSEPALHWHHQLKWNRSCVVDKRCVWGKSGEYLRFMEAANAELSTIAEFATKDMHSASRQNSNEYLVETISLEDLLTTHQAPNSIDYLSIDTEGSEFEILSNFDFKKWNINIITVEHNFTDQRDRISNLLRSNGYRNIMPEFSQFDDWYVR